jgi:Fe-S-cluster-containing dehydrogenase component
MKDVTRRAALKAGAGLAGVAATVRAVQPLGEWAQDLTLEGFLQVHYKQLDRTEMQDILTRLEAETLAEHGVEVHIGDHRPIPGVEFGYALNLSKCNGNRRCVEACHEENNHDRATNNSYIRVLKIEGGTVSLDDAVVDYEGPVPESGAVYLPVQCHQCDNPPCVSVCPIEATWKEADGIVVVDYDWCIGCRYCETACPYHARRFNWHEPDIPPDQINPDQGYLSNRIRPVGVAEKCTFCLHRTRQGLQPACLEACPTGARVFGNLLDPDSDIRWVVENKRLFILKEELGTVPRFFYYFDD